MPRRHVAVLHLIAAAALFFAAVPAHSTHPPPPPIDRSAWDWILIPVYAASPTPGASGALWSQRLIAFNGGSTDLVLRPHPWASCSVTCPRVPPLSTREIMLDRPAWAPLAPALQWIDRAAAENATFALRVHDLNAPDVPGVRVPVLRPHDLRTETLQILDVPVSPRLRSILRLYMATERPGGFSGTSYRFAVRVFRPVPHGVDVIESEHVISFTFHHMDDLPVNTRYAPIYDLFDQLEAGHVRIEIVPVDHSEPFWAFVATVDGVTRATSVFLP